MMKNTVTEGIRESNAAEILYAAAIGEVRAEPGRKLEILNGTAQNMYTQAEALASAKRVLEHAKVYGVQCSGAKLCGAPKNSGCGNTAKMRRSS